jgi:hypothetical protein
MHQCVCCGGDRGGGGLLGVSAEKTFLFFVL